MHRWTFRCSVGHELLAFCPLRVTYSRSIYHTRSTTLCVRSAVWQSEAWGVLCYHRLPRSRGQMSRSQRDITSRSSWLIAIKRDKSGTDSLTEFNLVKIMPETSATPSRAQRIYTVKVDRTNIEMAITPTRIARLRSTLVQNLTTAQPVYVLQMLMVTWPKGKITA